MGCMLLLIAKSLYVGMQLSSQGLSEPLSYSKMGSGARQPITPTRTRCQRFGRLDGLLTTLQPLLA